MQEKTLQIIFLGLATVALAVFLFFILKPFLGVVFLAGVLAVVFYPVYEWILRKVKERKNLAAFLTVLAIVVCLIIPVSLLSVNLIKEAATLYNSSVFGNASPLLTKINSLTLGLESVLPKNALVEVDLMVYARQFSGWFVGHFDSIFAAVFQGLFNFVLMLLAIFYFLISGRQIRASLINWSPLKDKYDIQFLETLKMSIDAVLYGRIFVSIVQGLFIGLGFVIFGVGSPVLWGLVGGIASLIPILGTSVIIIPATVYLFLVGNIGSGVGLIIWGALAVGLVDNVFSFFFFRNKINVHPLLVLFSILGGVELLGAIGFLVGPITVSALLALIKICPLVVFRENKTAG